MSLIFDALKKAEKDQQKNPNTSLKLPNPILQDNRAGAQKRILILLILFLVSAGFLAYIRFFKKSSQTAQTVPTPIAATSQKGDSSDPNFLKEKATALSHDNKLEEAQIIWQKLTLLLPTDSEVYNNLGFVLKKALEITAVRACAGHADEAVFFPVFSQLLAEGLGCLRWGGPLQE